jgi:hypothetical protein
MKVVNKMSSVILLVVVFCVSSLCDFPSVMGVSYSDSQKGGCKDCDYVRSKSSLYSNNCPSVYNCGGTYVSGAGGSSESGDTLDVTTKDVDANCTGNTTCEEYEELDWDSNCTSKTVQ